MGVSLGIHSPDVAGQVVAMSGTPNGTPNCMETSASNDGSNNIAIQHLGYEKFNLCVFLVLSKSLCFYIFTILVLYYGTKKVEEREVHNMNFHHVPMVKHTKS